MDPEKEEQAKGLNQPRGPGASGEEKEESEVVPAGSPDAGTDRAKEAEPVSGLKAGAQKQPRKKTGKEKVWSVVRRILLVVFAAVFVFSSVMLARELLSRNEATEELNNLRDQVHVSRPPLASRTPAVSVAPATSSEPGSSEPPVESGEPVATEEPEGPGEDVDFVALQLEAYQQLKEQNPDFFGWINIPNTKVDYPVMYTPRDTEYYLRLNFNKHYSNAGVPFIDGKCYKGSLNYIIYGHNINPDGMFATILQYRDRSYWEEHPIIQFDTTEELADYEILAAFNSRVYNSSDTGVFRYYYYQDISDPAKYEEFVRLCKEASLYDTGVDAQYGDQLITLSTCAYTYSTNLRFVVVARKITQQTVLPAEGDVPEASRIPSGG